MFTRYTLRAGRILSYSIQAGCQRLGVILSAGILCASLITVNEAAAQAQQPAPDAQAPSGQVPRGRHLARRALGEQ